MYYSSNRNDCGINPIPQGILARNLPESSKTLIPNMYSGYEPSWILHNPNPQGILARNLPES